MGIKELDHLKKSLSEIKSKSSELRKTEEKLDGFELDDFRTKERIQGLEVSIKVWTEKILKLKKRIDNVDYSEMEKTKFSKINNEIIQINKEIKSSGKAKHREDVDTNKFDSGVLGLVILWIVLPFVLSEGAMTLALGDEDTEYECYNGKIIPAHWINDGTDDCGDNSDEGVYETDELKEAMKKSAADGDQAFFGYCCGLPIFVLLLGNIIYERYVKMQMVSPVDEQKLARLKHQKIPYLNKENDIKKLKAELKSVKEKLSRGKREMDKKQLYLVNLQNSMIKTEQEIKDLRESIEETYASIKHLIPYSDYL